MPNVYPQTVSFSDSRIFLNSKQIFSVLLINNETQVKILFIVKTQQNLETIQIIWTMLLVAEHKEKQYFHVILFQDVEKLWSLKIILI